MHDTGYTMNSPAFEHLRGMGAIRPLPANDLSDEKVAAQKASHLWSIDELVGTIRAIAGWSYTAHEAVKLGERVATLGRAFYAMMAWDEETGVPTHAKMVELGIGWAANPATRIDGEAIT